MIQTDSEGDLAIVTLDRPERRNALTPAGLDALSDAVADATAPVLYLHGAGEAFCAGADLDVVDGLDASGARDFAEKGQSVARSLASYDGAVVAGIDGAARGGGVELALACDVRVCTPNGTLAESGVELGLFGAWGGTARLPAVVGPGMAADLALTGRVLDAGEAAACGLVSRVCKDPRSVAETIAAHDADAVRTIASLLRKNGSAITGCAITGSAITGCAITESALTGTAGGQSGAEDALAGAEEREQAGFADLVHDRSADHKD